MAKQRFRLKTLLHAISDDGQHRTITDLPAGAILTAVQEITALDRLVEVRWQDQSVYVFAEDLRSRADHLESAQA